MKTMMLVLALALSLVGACSRGGGDTAEMVFADMTANMKEMLPDVVTLNPKRDDVGDAIRAQTEGNVGCDVVIECVGNEHALKACLDAVRKQGVVVQTGLHCADPTT